MWRKWITATLAVFWLASDARAALDGQTYTVVAPIYNGAGGNVSYLRLYNPNTVETTFTVTVVGMPTARSYGVATYNLAPGAAPQYSITDILSRATAPALNGGDTGYALYLRAPPFNYTNAFQHLVWNASNLFFANISACTYSTDVNYADYNQTLINVHTTYITLYPTFVTVHNYRNIPVTFNVTITRSRDGAGAPLGIVPITVDANASYRQPVSWYEDQIGFVPQSIEDAHFNMTFEAANNEGPSAVVTQEIYNVQFGSYTAATQFCSINQ